MRRHIEGPESPAPLQTSGGGPASTPWREILPRLAFAGACFLVAPYLGLTSRTVDPRIAELWPAPGVGFVLLSTVWYAGRRVVLTTVAAMLLVFTGTALALGYPVLDSVWWSLAASGTACASLLAYRRLLGRTSWSPESPRDVGGLLGVTVAASLVCALVGGFPALHAGEVSAVLLWWVLRNTVFSFVAAVTFMVIFFRRSDVLPASSWPTRAVLVVVALVCVVAAYQDPSLPLSWLLVVPSIWGGLTLTVRGSAVLAVGVALIAAVMTVFPQNHFGYAGWLPAASIIDLLVVANTAFALLLALMREQRARLIDALDGKAHESETQRRMLSTVFDSMTDGVLLVGHEGVTMHNAAARVLVGRPIPLGRPLSWATTFGATAVDGSALGDDAIRARLFDATGRPSGQAVEVVVGQGESARVLELSARPLSDDQGSIAMILLHDVTGHRARLRELSNFAGIVAHDLRGPLTVLEGWLEFAADGVAAADLGRVDEALPRVGDASRRMRQVIEDWLGYTVVQNGQLHPAPVALDDLAAGIADGYRARHTADAEPRFYLDLPHTVEADPAMLRQLVDNLVGNAIKYTEAGTTPRIAITSEPDTEPGWVLVEVSDQGLGIPEGQEDQIFEEFHRGPAQGRTASTGLGLALTRRIVALHGGRLRARRNPEGGSTFAFTLPAA